MWKLITLIVLSSMGSASQTSDGIIEGAVIRLSTGQPIVDAQVELLGATRIVAVTDLQGRYVFKGVPAGAHTIRARAEGSLGAEAGTPASLSRRNCSHTSSVGAADAGRDSSDGFSGTGRRSFSRRGIAIYVILVGGEPSPAVTPFTRDPRHVKIV